MINGDSAKINFDDYKSTKLLLKNQMQQQRGHTMLKKYGLTLIISIMIMITPIIVYTQFSFDSALHYGQIAVYVMITLSFIFGLWLIKIDVIDSIKRQGK